MVISNILESFAMRDNFLITGHQNPDEDCISSMISVAILIAKFGKTVTLIIPEKINDNFQYLLNICRYNRIQILNNAIHPPSEISTVCIMDTPKPSMQEVFPGKDAFYYNPSILKIEIDHHLAADSDYNGENGYCLVDEASSASELVGLMAFKLTKREDLLNGMIVPEVLTRNLILTILTGIIGDSKMGKYLKTRKERWFYDLFSSLFNDLLAKTTRQGSGNFSTMDEVFNSLQQLSRDEDDCFRMMMKNRIIISEKVAVIFIPQNTMDKIRLRFDQETIITVARYSADKLSEMSGYLGLIGYFDSTSDSSLIQFRLRRNHNFRELDLREFLKKTGIVNGGGHPGAIGFRLEKAEVSDPSEFLSKLVKKLEQLIDKT